MGSTISRAIILRHPAAYSIQYSEECAASCRQYGIPYEFFDGYYTTDYLELNHLSGWNFPNAWVKEYCCTAGHLNIWRKIIDEGGGAVAVLEHDAIVKRRMDDIEIMDGEVAFLGLRVESRDDYECIQTYPRMIPVNTFEGTHAYALTPITARRCIANIQALSQFPWPIDGLMGIHNTISQRLLLVDPCPVVCEVGGGRKSFTQFESAKYNILHPPGFMAGLKNPDRYTYDPGRQRMVFNTEKDFKFSNPDPKAVAFVKESLEKANIDRNKVYGIVQIGCFEGEISCLLSDNVMGNVNSAMYVVDDFSSPALEMIPGDIHSRAPQDVRFHYNINLTKARLQSYMIKAADKNDFQTVFEEKNFKADIIYHSGFAEPKHMKDHLTSMFNILSDDGILILNNTKPYNHVLKDFLADKDWLLITGDVDRKTIAKGKISHDPT